jgi:tRNA-specific 2-thiouridylase
MARVVVGLSGGVDSSVAAKLLLDEGHEVIGLFMRNWHDDTVILDDECPWVEDSNDAMLVAEKLGIPFQVIDLSNEYKERIVDYMFAEYEAGRTPNPDVLCNREIKFDIFLKTALKLGAEHVATGHYCQKDVLEKNGQKVYRLLAGADPNKDQSYFLCQLNQEQLARALFPIGHLQKSEVREIARKEALVTAEKKDSQGLCFIGKVSLPTFLQQKLEPKEGDIIELPDDPELWQPALHSEAGELEALTARYEFRPEQGKVVGKHRGAHYFTVGQRKGLMVGGTPEPLFILATDTGKNLIYTGQGDQHRGLSKKGLFIRKEDIHWVRDDLAMENGDSRSYQMRIRYRQPLFEVQLYKEPNGMYVIFDEPQKAITPGQFAAWYENNELIGSGVIDY